MSIAEFANIDTLAEILLIERGIQAKDLDVYLTLCDLLRYPSLLIDSELNNYAFLEVCDPVANIVTLWHQRFGGPIITNPDIAWHVWMLEQVDRHCNFAWCQESKEIQQMAEQKSKDTINREVIRIQKIHDAK